MGWTVFGGVPRGGMPAKVLKALNYSSDGYKSRVLKSAIVGGNVYAAVECSDGVDVKVRGVVGLIEGAGYKLLGEECGPYYYGCPAEILAMLSPTSEPWALKWRAKCAEAA